MSGPKRALLARLDEEGRATLANFLADKGFEVVPAATGQAALEVVRNSLPDLVVADGVLPKLSGFELCRKVKELAGSRHVPVVLLLEEGDSYGRGRARVEGADLILSEPLVEDDLQEILTAAAGQAAAGAEVFARGGASRDRFVKALMRDATSPTDAFVSRISDPLTGLTNRAYTAFKLEEEFKKARRYGSAFALVMVEIDNFEDAVRTHGKPIAKEMLLEVAGVFLCESRDVDTAGRVDDARFLLLLPLTDLDGARRMADRVFQQVCSRKVVAGGVEIPIRTSVGIVALPNDDVGTVDEFVERALRGLRTARNMGGNRICAWSDR